MSTTLRRTEMETSDEFRLLVAEIANEENCSILEARRRARALWGELGGASADEPAGVPVVDWRYVSFVLACLLALALAALAALVWLVATAA